MSNVAIDLTGVTKLFGNKLVVDGLSFTVASGECFGLLGPNGAGKST
ncbi:MAG: ATP-binding cassette domain-containing protein, partial [Mesorhizobium sp.]